MGFVIAFTQAVCWAGTTIALRALSVRMNAFLINGLRAAVGCLFVIPVAALTAGAADASLLTPARVAYILASVLVGGVVGDYLYLQSLRTLGVGRAFPITSSHPVFTVLFGALLLGDAVDAATVAGMAVVLAGVYLVARPHGDVAGVHQAAPLAPRQMLLGVATAIATALASAAGTTILAFALTDGISPVVVNAIRLPTVMIVSLAIAGRGGQLAAVRRLDRRTLGLVALAGTLGFALGGTLYTTAVQMIGPGRAALISSTAPIFAVPMSYALLRERPTRATLLGTAVTVAGIMLVV